MRIYALLCLAVLTMVSCGSKGDMEPEHEPKTLDLEIVLGGNEIDTIIAVKDFQSAITEIKVNDVWLSAEIIDSADDSCQFKVICAKNTTTSIRLTQVIITCKNGDTLTLKVTQKVLDGFDDLHDNVTDQPAMAPAR